MTKVNDFLYQLSMKEVCVEVEGFPGKDMRIRVPYDFVPPSYVTKRDIEEIIITVGVLVKRPLHTDKEVKIAIDFYLETILSIGFTKASFATRMQEEGRLTEMARMELLAHTITIGSNEGLTYAFQTQGFKGYDGIGIIANDKEYEDMQGYILYDDETERAVFIRELEKEELEKGIEL